MLKEYQEWSRTTAVYPEYEAIEYLTLGLCSEAGEVASKVKKCIRGDAIPPDSMGQLADEVGDVLWYAIRLLDEMDFSVEDVLRNNQKKLNDRKERQVLKGDGDRR